MKENEGDSALQGLLIYMKGTAGYGSAYKLATRKRCTGSVRWGTDTVGHCRELWLW
jgi:hypothetical protein